MGKTIVTTFAGRQDRMSILYDYLKTALDRGIIDEYHIWDFARNPADAKWLTQLGEIYSTPADENKIHYPSLSLHKMEHLSLQIRTSLEVSINIYNYDESKFVTIKFKNDKVEIQTDFFNKITTPTKTILSAGDFNEFFILNQDNRIKIQHGEDILTEIPIEIEWDHFTISSKGRTDWIFNDQEPRIKLFRCTKSAPHWEEYYTYYSEEEYKDDIFIKMDDDLVYLDLDHLKEFVEFRKTHPQYFLVSANVINNGVCAYHQQQYGAIDKSIMRFSYDTFKGKLWESGQLAERLHRYFIHNTDRFNYQGYVRLPLGDRLSINCVSWLGRDFKEMRHFNYYDEEQMSQQVPKKLRRQNVIYNNFIVSHLSFYSQEQNMELQSLISQYRTFKEFYLNKTTE